MYESPIEMIIGQMHIQQENGVYKAVQNVGFNVNKDELLKALQYDRDQYNKGYFDGIQAFAERLKAHKIRPEFPWDDFYVTEAFIDYLVKEMAKGSTD